MTSGKLRKSNQPGDSIHQAILTENDVEVRLNRHLREYLRSRIRRKSVRIFPALPVRAGPDVRSALHDRASHGIAFPYSLRFRLKNDPGGIRTRRLEIESLECSPITPRDLKSFGPTDERPS